MKKAGKILKKVVLILVGFILLLMLIVFLFFQFPAVQNYVADQALKIAQNKFDTELGLEKVIIVPPNSVKLREAYVEGSKGDTLIYAEKLSVNIGLFKLLNRRIEVNRFKLENANAKLIKSGPDSSLNIPFATKNDTTNAKKSQEKKEWQFDIDRVLLEDVRFLYKDELKESRYFANIGQFRIRVNTFNPTATEFGVRSVRLSESIIELSMNEDDEDEESSDSSIPDIKLSRSIDIEDVDFLFVNSGSNQKIDIQNINLSVRSDELDLPGKEISLRNISLEETDINMIIPGNDTEEVPNEAAPKESFEWKIKLSELNLDENSLRFITDTTAPRTPSFNPENINIQGLSGEISEINYSEDLKTAHIEDLGFREKDDFQLQNLQALLELEGSSLNIENFGLQTPATFIHFNLLVRNLKFENLKRNLKDLYLNLNLENSYIGIRDIKYFYPEIQLNQYDKAIRNLSFETDIQGRVSDLSINKFRASVGEDIIMKFYGDISGLPEVQLLEGKLTVDSVYIAGNQIRTYLPDSLIPKQIHIPDDLLLEAVASGTPRLSRGSIDISSTAGGIEADLQLDIEEKSDREYFQANIISQGLDLGTILQKPDTIGKIVVEADIKGSTSNFKNPTAQITIDMDTFNLINYNYTDFMLHGKYDQKKFEGTAGMNDENIRFSFNGMVDASDSIPDTDFTFNLIGANLQAMNLSQEDIRVGAILKSEISGSKPGNANGFFRFNDIVVVRDNEVHELDSLVFRAKNTENNTELMVSSGLVEANYQGSVKPEDISSDLWSHLNLFFPIEQGTAKKPEIPKKFDLEAHIHDHPILSEAILPGLVSFRGIDINMSYNQDNNLLEFRGLISPLHYKNFDIDSILVDIDSKDSVLLLSLNSKGVRQDPLNIPGIVSEIKLGNNIADWTFQINDEENEEKYLLGGKLRSENGQIKGKFDASQLVLNYHPWNLPENHSFSISEDSISFSNMRFYRENQELLLTKRREGSELRGLQLDFSAFRLQALTNMLTTEDLLSAKINGQIVLNTQEDFRFSTELQITDLNISGEQIFNMIALKAEQNAENQIEFNGQFQEQDQRIRLNGNYAMGPKNEIDLNILIDGLILENFQPLLSEQFRNLKGQLQGDIKVSGPVNKPDINGDIQLMEAVVAARALGTSFRSKNIQLQLENDNLIFTHFDVLDSEGNEFALDGSVNEIFSGNPVLDVQANAEDFTAVNANEDVNDRFYGRLNLDLSANITGNVSSPEIRGTTTITDKTDFNFIIPPGNKATIEQEGLVVFIQSEKDTSSILYSDLEDEEIQVGAGENIDLNATLEIEEEAVLNIVIDPGSGENLQVQGEANLNLTKQHGGDISLTGTYRINEGTYNLSLYDLVRRQFSIQEGSSINWTGDPLAARADITAVYEVRTSPEGLIGNEVSEISEQQRQQLSKSIPFLVYLNIKGELLSPSVLDFDIETPPGTAIPEVNSKLNQLNQNESAVNKQAIALLTFGSFIQSQMSTSHPVSYEINAAARSSISRILSSQLNKLAKQYIEGIQIDVDVNSYADYSASETQSTTNVALDVEKEFFNERLTVKVGGRVNIEGNEKQANNMNRLAGDVMVLYDITENGRFKLKGFNTTEYENILEGEITKTGVGVIYNRDVYKLSDLFKKWKKDNEEDE